MLRSITFGDNKTTSFSYLANTGLLTSKVDSAGMRYTFSYEKNGRIKEIIEPNNILTNINYFINASGVVTSLDRSDGYREEWISNKTTTNIYKSKQQSY